MEADNELVKQIRQTLNNYQEDYIPGSWERFADKQKKRKRILFIRWSSGMAASLLIGWFAASLIFNPDKQVLKEPAQSTAQNNVHQASAATTDTNKTIPIEQIKSRTENTITYTSANRTRNSKLKSNHNQESRAQNEIAATSTQKRNEQNVLDLNQDTSGTIQKQDNNQNYVSYSDTDSSTQNIWLANAQKNTSPTNRVQDSGLSVSQPTIILSPAAIDSALRSYQMPLAENQQEDEKKTNRRVRFGVNISPGVNTTQSAAAMNYGGGVNTDIELFANIQLSTGLQLEHQNVIDNGGNSDIPSGGTNANLLSLDVPINVTWKFYSGKTKSYYVSSGISSLAYLDQKYENTNYVYTLVETYNGTDAASYQMDERSKTEENQLKPFETFDFAGRVNIVFGLEQMLSPKLFLHIEPYVKIPISGLGAEKLKFTTSGITCKVSF